MPNGKFGKSAIPECQTCSLAEVPSGVPNLQFGRSVIRSAKLAVWQKCGVFSGIGDIAKLQVRHSGVEILPNCKFGTPELRYCQTASLALRNGDIAKLQVRHSGVEILPNCKFGTPELRYCQTASSALRS
ncbi:hypothetical protein [Desulfonema magnum]|uniref:hypothetical protein n=1 Tax=Desulfonema magnum TaxID=45655 RepID=UPI001A9AE6BB|nr:hypothetical protein [Desulfonema magnum]